MTPNLYVHDRRERLMGRREGQALPLFLVTGVTLLALVLSVVHLAMLQGETVHAANGADAISLSVATWEARGLNVVAALNDGVIQCLRVIRYICAVWAGLAVAAAFGVGIPAFNAYSRYARSAIRSYWTLAQRLAAWAERVRNGTPAAALAEAAALMKRYGAAALLRPSDPAGRHDGPNTLELHLSPTREVRLGDAFAPLHRAIRKISGCKGAGWVSRALDGAIRAFTGEFGPPILLLEPEADLPARQRVSVAALVADRSTSPPLSVVATPSRFPAVSEAEVYGGGATAPTWRSRLCPEGGSR